MISAIVLAAGQSTRMGKQKMLMPWGETTVIAQVVATLLKSGITDVRVVTGGSDHELKIALKDYVIRYIFNKDYSNGEMLLSVQIGLASLKNSFDAVLIVLGDQPQMETHTVETLLGRFMPKRSKIIVPSYKMHRGHPWLVEKSYWNEIISLKPPLTLHNFLNKHQKDIDYVIVETPSILQDLDEKSDYEKYRP